MTIFLYFIGLAAGAAVFIYIISLYNSGKKKVVGITKKKKEEKKPVVPQEQSKLPIFSIPPGERMCPLCRTTLSKREALYASRVFSEDTAKILILGCRYCYKKTKR